jgi:ATP-binding protein involved in chromosome partitioning
MWDGQDAGSSIILIPLFTGWIPSFPDSFIPQFFPVILGIMPVTDAAVLGALAVVRDPDLHRDIVSLGFIKDLKIDGDRVAFTIELTTPACPVKDQMRDQARAAVMQLPGVASVDVTMSASVRSASLGGDGPRQPIPGVKNIVAVGAGKGGVGKTTVAVNLALALAKCGSKVGLIDGDIYGPNVPIMLGLKTQLMTDGQKIVPAEKYGLQVISMGFLTADDAPIIWRGPMLHGALQQFFREVRWTNLDYLIIDMPPGTGDVALTLSQSVPTAGAIVVTTPQQVSLADTRRAVAMYKKLNIQPLGLIENMSYFTCPDCGHESDIFGRGGGENLAAELGVPFLGRIPIYQPIREGSDVGIPLVVAEPEVAATRAFIGVAEQTAAQLSIASYTRPTIPLTPVP